MDLVSSTLDKYLKHRFNGHDTNNVPLTNGHTDTDLKQTIDMPKINHVVIRKMQPCCVTIRDDLKYIAAGFEDSHIYLWTLSSSNSTNLETQQKHQHEHRQEDIGYIEINNHNIDIKIAQLDSLIAHGGPVYCIKFFNHNDLMLSCSEDTTIRLWCLNEKCNIFVYRGHNYPVWSLDIAPQGNLFASTSMDTTARLWVLDKMAPIRIFCGHDDDVECVKFHPNEKYIATGSSDSTIRLWSISDGKMVRLMVGHQNPIISLSFHSNGKFLTSASRDGIVKIWNLATNSVTSEFNSIPPSYTISFSLDQAFIASCGMDKVLRLYQMDEQAQLIEKRSFDFQSQETNLIQSQFHKTSNKLFITRYVNPNQNQELINNSKKPTTSTTTTATLSTMK